MGEDQLVAGLKNGSPLAERRFYDLHVERVYLLALRMAGDPELARTFTQDAFVRAFDAIRSFRGEARLSTWLHSVTVSAVLDGLRRLERRRDREVPLESAPERSVPGEPAVEPDLRERLHRELLALPEIYRVVVVMYDLEGYTHDEIADALGVRPGTSRARLSRARAMLKDALSEHAEEFMS